MIIVVTVKGCDNGELTVINGCAFLFFREWLSCFG